MIDLEKLKPEIKRNYFPFVYEQLTDKLLIKLGLLTTQEEATSLQSRTALNSPTTYTDRTYSDVIEDYTKQVAAETDYHREQVMICDCIALDGFHEIINNAIKEKGLDIEWNNPTNNLFRFDDICKSLLREYTDHRTAPVKKKFYSYRR